MPTLPAPRRELPPPRVRVALACLALACAGWVVARAVGLERHEAELERRVLPLVEGSRQSSVAQELARAGDPLALELVAVRRLFEGALRASGERARPIAQLELAAELAARAVARQPLQGEALAAQGATIYLLRSTLRDPRLLTEPQAWEEPLERARTLAPARADAQRFLAVAYLELWRFLPESKKRHARQLVARALEEPYYFERIVKPWLTVAGTVEDALAPMPEDPAAWEKLLYFLGQRFDWSGLARAHEGHFTLLERRAGAVLARAEAALAAGRPSVTRTEILGLVPELPVDGRFAALLGRALTLLPAGPLEGAAADALAPWLDWELERCLAGRCALPPPALSRLGFAAAARDEASAAAAALAAGDLAQAEQLERRSVALEPARWARYRLLLARALAQRGDLAGARAALARVPVAPSLELATTWAEQAIERRPSQRHQTAWQRHERRAQVGLVLDRPATGLEIAWASLPADGATVELVVDGERAAVAAVEPGERAWRVRRALTAGPHTIEVRTLSSNHGEPAVPVALEVAGSG
jgi:hypothetical protein